MTEPTPTPQPTEGEMPEQRAAKRQPEVVEHGTEGPYKVERRISNMDGAKVYVLSGPTITGDEYMTPSFPEAAAKDLNNAFQAGASSRGTVDVAARQMLIAYGPIARPVDTPNEQEWASFHRAADALAASLNGGGDGE